MLEDKRYTDSDGNECDLPAMCRREPGWAANRIAALLAERQRHAEEVARLEARCHALEEQLGKLTEQRQRHAAEIREAIARASDAIARAWEEGAEAAFDAEYSGPLFGRALDEFYASNPYRRHEPRDDAAEEMSGE